jgi:hypothetical protein
MAIDLSDYIDSLRREVTPPGSTLFTDVSDAVMVGYLADGFWEARLDGLLVGFESDPDGIVTPLVVGADDLSRAPISLIILYAGIRILRNKILNTNTMLKATAGSVAFEQQNSATVLAEMLKQLRITKDQLLLNSAVLATRVSMVDAFSVRQLSWASYYGNYNLTDGLY